MTADPYGGTDLPPGLNPGALVVRMSAQCGAILVPVSPLGHAPDPDTTADEVAAAASIVGTHHADLVELHRADCWCRGICRTINDGDDGTLIAAEISMVLPDGRMATLVRTREDFAGHYLPDLFGE